MTQVQMVRLIADKGKLLTDGNWTGKVIDVCPAEDAAKWYEVDEPEREESIELETIEGE